MIIDEIELRSKLASFSLDNPHEALTFSQRLARENGWPPTFTERVITEYKRFLFLCMISPHPVTPSDEVDQAWHLHLVYTKSYWKDLCKDLLGKDIHHTPTEGGPAERDKFTSYYESTLQLYRDKFGHAPPDDIWPPTVKRFANANFIRADTTTHWVIRKRRWHNKLTGILFIVLGFIGAAIAPKVGWTAFLFFIGIVLLTNQKRSQTSLNGSTGCSGGCGGDSGCNGDGGCSGGCSGCGGGCGGD